MRIAVVGSGYVGLVAGVCFAELGHEVVLVDNDPEKGSALNAGTIPIHERFLPELLERYRASRLSFSGDLAEAVRSCAVIFISVGTPPTVHGEADMSYVEAVAGKIARSLTGYKIIVGKSTVPVTRPDRLGGVQDAGPRPESNRFQVEARLGQAIDTLLRYHTTFERSFERTLNQLLKLQALRRNSEIDG